MNGNLFLKKVEQLALKHNIRINLLVIAGEAEAKPFDRFTLNMNVHSAVGYLEFVKRQFLLKFDEARVKTKGKDGSSFPGVQ